jgi:DNA-binding PucR family transcriptional regulator
VSQTAKFLSLREVASEIDDCSDLDTILRRLIVLTCKHANWGLGSIMAIDPAQGLGHVLVRHDPALIGGQLADQWDLATSPALVALRRNEPVYIRDAREAEAYPGYRQDALARDYRTVLVMPMNCTDALGRPLVLSVISRHVTEVGEEALAHLGTILHLGALAVAHEHRLSAQRRMADRLKQALTTQTELLEHVLRDGSVPDLAAMASHLLPNPAVVVDLTANQVIAGRSPDPGQFDDAAWQEAAQGPLLRPLTKAAREAASQPAGLVPLLLQGGARTLRLPARVEPMFVGQQLVGAMIVFPASPDLDDLDQLILDSAKVALGTHMMRSHIRYRAETRTQTELFMELAEGRWQDAKELIQRALRIGLNLGRPQQMVVVDFSRKPTAPTWVSTEIARAVARTLQGVDGALCIAVEGGAVCLVPPDPVAQPDRTARLTRRLAEDLGRHFDEVPIVAVSDPCRRPEDYPAAWERCARMIRIARTFGLTGALAVQDFGPLAMLIARLEAGEVTGFVDSSIGALVRHDQAHGSEFLPTLAAYLREGCRSQACADALGLHVSTLRHRLARMRDLFGIEVDVPERRFALELAVRLHTLTGGS